MFNRKAFILSLGCMSFCACNNKPQKVVVWDSYLDYDTISEECSDTVMEDTVYSNRQILEYTDELEEPQEVVVTSNCYELPAYKEEDIIVKHTAYTLSFNKETNLANWVAWTLTSGKSSGKYSRTDDFRADELLPINHRIDETAYRGTGYDRGHMCPAADNKWSYQAMSESFLMSNICPQDPELNKVWWEHLEEAERRWARQEGKVYICCGPIFSGNSTTRLECDVTVPDAFFKVILSLKKNDEKAIGFYYVNDARRQTMEFALRSVDEIERITGYDFFSNVVDEIENKVEQFANLRKWN